VTWEISGFVLEPSRDFIYLAIYDGRNRGVEMKKTIKTRTELFLLDDFVVPGAYGEI
jgi:hypothetical protein